MTLTFPRTNDSHRNARNYQVDSQTPENTSHFAMRITLFSSLIHTMNLSVVNTMLYDSPDLIIHRTEIWAVWRPQVGFKKVWRFLTQQFDCCTAQRGMPVHCPAGTKSLPNTLHVAGSSMTSLWRREAASKNSGSDSTRISSFVTTMKLP